MIENLDFLPTWIKGSAIPASFVMGFFWKGDEALSEDFRKWLSQKILGLKLTVPDIASIEPLGKVFDFIYGPRYFALTTFARVAAVSIIALLVSFLLSLSLSVWTIKDAVDALENMQSPDKVLLTFSIVGNIFFDYVSVTKSRLLIEWLKRYSYSAIKFLICDLVLTLLVLNPVTYAIGYFGAMLMIPEPSSYTSSYPERIFTNVLNAYHVAGGAFTLTVYMSLLLTLLYLASLILLKLYGLIAKATTLAQWMLPVQTLLVRSIGIVAGALLFCFLEALHAFVG